MPNWKIRVTPVGPLQMNSVLVTVPGPDGPASVLIDPGAEPERLLQIAREAGAPVVAMVATHGHFDHVGAAAEVQQELHLPLLCHTGDLPLIHALPETMRAFGFPPAEVPRCEAVLGDDHPLIVGGHEIAVRHVPGHSPGHVMFLFPGRVVAGDCLFKGSIGRTDLPGGNFDILEKSIRERIYTLPDETVVICGHGPDTTVGDERTGNPFVRD